MTAIDWSKLTSHKASQHKSFEQLCYQIATRLHGDRGNVWPIDDSGGGDGVEFYMVLPNGNECGWQAKFYDREARLTTSRKAQIIKSLKKAIKVHPRLSQWILCTNSDLTPKEKEWFQTKLRDVIPRSRKIKLDHWGHTRIHAFLGQSECNGIKNLFFNQLELNEQWFNTAFQASYHLVENKYDADVHTQDSETDFWYVAPLLVTSRFKARIVGVNRELKEKCDRFKRDSTALRALDLTNVQCRPVQPKLVSILNRIETELAEVQESIENFIEYLTPNKIHHVWNYDPEQSITKLDTLHSELKRLTLSEPIEFEKSYKPANGSDNKRLSSIKHILLSPLHQTDQIKVDIRDIFRFARIAERNHLHLLAAAGKGKTHLSVALAKERIDLKLPAIFIPASRFNEVNSIAGQILDQLDIRSNYSFDDLLQTLSALGSVRNMRVPIIIDGLNESVTTQGLFNSRLADELPGIVAKIAKFPNVALITTCRLSYKGAIWNTEPPPEGVKEIYEFGSPTDVKELVKKYFTKYKIISEHSYFSLRQFSTPLLLKLFCEVHRSPTNEPVHIVIGHESIYETFRLFVTKCDQKVYDQLLPYYGPVAGIKNVVVSSLHKIAQQIWSGKVRWLPFNTFGSIVDGDGPVDYSKSKAKSLIDQELLFISDWRSGGQSVGFTFDMFAGYAVAEYLIDQYKTDIHFFLKSDAFKALCRAGRENDEPFHEDILECLAALLPARVGLHLCTALSRAFAYEPAVMASLRAMFSISAELVGEQEQNFIIDLFQRPGNRKYLLTLAENVFFAPNHPLNMNLWFDLLSSLPVFERDLVWTERWRNRSWESHLELTEEFENCCAPQKQLPASLKAKTDLVAKFLAWELTTTISKLRKKIRESLYLYGLKYTDEFLQIFKHLVTVNDPQLVEQICRCMYSVVLTKHVDKSDTKFITVTLPKLTRFIFEQFFQTTAPGSTTHVAIRDYTINTVIVGLKHSPTTLSAEEQKLIYPPFSGGGIRNWGQAEDKDKKRYHEGNTLVDYSFEKEKMPHLSRSDQYNPSKEYLGVLAKLRWRAYQLGYDFAKVGEIDQAIARLKHYEDEYVSSTEKYGEKYINIAYYELLGLTNDVQQLKIIRTVFEEDDQDDLPRIVSKTQPPFITKDFLSNSKTSLKAWVSNRSVPPTDGYTFVKTLSGLAGPWTLLHLVFDQYDKTSGRNFYLNIQAILFNREDFKATKNTISASQPHIHIPEQRQVFAQEIPDSEMFEANGITRKEVEVKNSRVVVSVTERHLVKGTKRLTDQQEQKFWKRIRTLYGQDIYRVKTPQGSTLMNLPAEEFDSNTSLAAKKVFAEIRRQGLALKEFKTRAVRNVSSFKKIAFLLPITKINAGVTVAKELAMDLHLVGKTGDLNLFVAGTGQQATAQLSSGTGNHNHQNQLFIRKELLDSFMAKHDLMMAFLITGERQYLATLERRDQNAPNPHWTSFGKIVPYLK